MTGSQDGSRTPRVSIVIPNRNGADTIDACLRAALASQHPDFEVVVVDDCSEDDSARVIQRFSCRLVRLGNPVGAGEARNEGARHGRGEVLFFTDADCLLRGDAVARACDDLLSARSPAVVGGTYTLRAADDSFFSHFQSAFINYFETKRADDPDYVATHAMAMRADTFRLSGGFSGLIRPILEDVELSHRMRRQGITLMIDPDIQVGHIFNFSLSRSLRNAFRKSMYWTRYSIGQRYLMKDSGTASMELKSNVALYVLSWLNLLLFFASGGSAWLWLAAGMQVFNVWINRGLLLTFYRSGGTLFACGAMLYYLLLYPLPVGLGGVAGAIRYWRGS